MDSTKTSKIGSVLLGCIALYLVSYGFVRANVFHMVEHYPDGKGGGRQNYVTKRDQPPGQGWEYRFFLPAIKLEETLTNGIF